MTGTRYWIILLLVLMTLAPARGQEVQVLVKKTGERREMNVSLRAGDNQGTFSLTRISGLRSHDIIVTTMVVQTPALAEYRLKMVPGNTILPGQEVVVVDVTTDEENLTVVSQTMSEVGEELPSSDTYSIQFQLMRTSSKETSAVGWIETKVVRFGEVSSDTLVFDLGFLGEQDLQESREIFSKWYKAEWELLLPWKDISSKIANVELSGQFFTDEDVDERYVTKLSVQGVGEKTYLTGASEQVKVTLEDVNVDRENNIAFFSKVAGTFTPVEIRLELKDEPRLFPLSIDLDQPAIGYWTMGLSWGAYLVGYRIRRKKK